MGGVLRRVFNVLCQCLLHVSEKWNLESGLIVVIETQSETRIRSDAVPSVWVVCWEESAQYEDDEEVEAMETRTLLCTSLCITTKVASMKSFEPGNCSKLLIDAQVVGPSYTVSKT